MRYRGEDAMSAGDLVFVKFYERCNSLTDVALTAQEFEALVCLMEQLMGKRDKLNQAAAKKMLTAMVRFKAGLS
jgi:hypothetical protein